MTTIMYVSQLYDSMILKKIGGAHQILEDIVTLLNHVASVRTHFYWVG